MIYESISFTPEGGLAIRLINKTGSTTVRGEVVKAGSAFNGFIQAPANEDMPIGVVYDDGVAADAPCRIVVAGRAQVLMKDSTATTVGYVLYVSATAGRADVSATVPSATTHWRELGHCLESAASGTNKLCWAVLHFN